MREFRFPDIGEGISEGVLLEWLVEVGDEVKEGDDLFLVETDKVNAEIPSPRDGVIAELLGEEGETINVGDVVVVFADDATKDAAAEEKAAAVEEEEEEAGVVGLLETSAQVFEASSEHISPTTDGVKPRALATPAVRQYAKERGVDLLSVNGSGPQGRVTKEDVEAALDGATAKGKGSTALEERIPLTTLGKTIAANMALSKKEIPHAAIFAEFDVTDLVGFRNEAKKRAEEEGVRLTYMPFILKAVTLALKEFPYFNASFSAETEEIILKNVYNIGIAVDTPDGLLVPVIKDADRFGFLELARQVQTLAKKAVERTLTIDEVQGGTFTVTNYGAVGALSGLPVIKHPDAAILGIGSITKKPVVREDEIVIRHILPLTLAFDHRFIDGGNAGRFMQRLKEYLEEPLLLLLA
ncbi:MAG TPA: 2-oxo acid dehydrogenase subunit E2 [Firmicutes bacterium]|nr:2-oxo acid dehydrogenase subunit E2 [Bacillota bacterium]